MMARNSSHAPKKVSTSKRLRKRKRERKKKRPSLSHFAN